MSLPTKIFTLHCHMNREPSSRWRDSERSDILETIGSDFLRHVRRNRSSFGSPSVIYIHGRGKMPKGEYKRSCHDNSRLAEARGACWECGEAHVSRPYREPQIE